VLCRFQVLTSLCLCQVALTQTLGNPTLRSGQEARYEACTLPAGTTERFGPIGPHGRLPGITKATNGGDAVAVSDEAHSAR